MHIRVLLLCSRENAQNVLDCLITQPDVTVEYSRNVREFLLKIANAPINLIIADELKESIALSSGKDLELEHLLVHIKHKTKSADVPVRIVPTQEYPGAFKVARMQFEKEYLTSALAEHGANISQTAGAIGTTRRNLQLKIKQLHIDIERIRRELTS
jgi:transcriptional regulator with GAF, ATPase, and Fis domain